MVKYELIFHSIMYYKNTIKINLLKARGKFKSSASNSETFWVPNRKCDPPTPVTIKLLLKHIVEENYTGKTKDKIEKANTRFKNEKYIDKNI